MHQKILCHFTNLGNGIVLKLCSWYTRTESRAGSEQIYTSVNLKAVRHTRLSICQLMTLRKIKFGNKAPCFFPKRLDSRLYYYAITPIRQFSTSAGIENTYYYTENFVFSLLSEDILAWKQMLRKEIWKEFFARI